MSKKTLYLIGISVVIAFCIVMIINVYDMNKLPDPKPGATAAPKAEAVTAAMVADMIEGVLRNNFLYDYKTKLDEEQGLFNVDIWSSDITAESIQRTKDSGNFSVWDNMVSDIASTTATMQNAFDENGHGEIIVVTSLCDPENQDVAFLTIANGVAGYDVVNGVDLLNK